MGFRPNSWATCWGVECKSDTLTVGRISTSRKNKQSNEYEQDFSGFVSFIGTATAKKAANLKEKDRIKLGEVEVTTKYDEANKKSYTNFRCYDFKTQAELESADKSKDAAQSEIEDKSENPLGDLPIEETQNNNPPW